MASIRSKEEDKKEDKGEGDARPPAEPVPWYRQLLTMKDTLIIVITPLLFLPILFVYDSRVSMSHLTKKCDQCIQCEQPVVVSLKCGQPIEA